VFATVIIAGSFTEILAGVLRVVNFIRLVPHHLMFRTLVNGGDIIFRHNFLNFYIKDTPDLLLGLHFSELGDFT